GIAGLADGGDTPILDADIGLHDPPMIENERIGDHRIDCAILTRTLRLAHAVADDFAAAELHLFPVSRKILLHLDDEVAVRHAQSAAARGAKTRPMGGSAHRGGHFGSLADPSPGVTLP